MGKWQGKKTVNSNIVFMKRKKNICIINTINHIGVATLLNNNHNF